MPTSQEVETLVMQLERNAGAHTHTASKARTYLRMIVNKPDATFSNCTAEEFVKTAKNAANMGKWEELSTLMSRWW